MNWCLQVQEVGDGNINFVYIVTGPTGAVCIKQGLPFVRIASEWPLTQVMVRGSIPYFHVDVTYVIKVVCISMIT